MTQPTPPPRCRVCKDTIEICFCSPDAVFHYRSVGEFGGHYCEPRKPIPHRLERRVSGERRKLDRRIGKYWSSQMRERKGDNRNWRKPRRISDRRKAGKL